jgi:undecaprenyl diphosphate synthase
MTDQKLHIAIIPDGNRRWAKERTLFPWKGHERAVENFRSLLEYAKHDDRVGVITFWCFSTENWKRDEGEVTKLFELLENYLLKERAKFIEERVRFVHSGRRDRLPSNIVSLMTEMEKDVTEEPVKTLHLAIDYGGKDEILRALEKIPEGMPVTDDVLRSKLDHPELPDMDLIIRTSGEMRTSNFALWQSTYAEWMFEDIYFPDFSPEHFKKCIDSFVTRTRRFGA